MKIERIPVDAVEIGGRRPVDGAAVAALAASMRLIGQMQPITVYEREGAAHLIAGRHRLEAAQFLGWDHIEAVFVSGDEIDHELQEISENLHRSDLTVQERSDQTARWVELVDQRNTVSAQLGQKLGRPEGGDSKAARDLNISRQQVERAKKIAGISDEAKEAAKDAGIDNNQSKLLAVASVPTESQVAKAYELKGTPISKTWRDNFQTLWGKGTQDDHAWARDFIDGPVMNARHG